MPFASDLADVATGNSGSEHVMRTYYFRFGGDIVGPMSLDDLRKFVSVGNVKADTLVGYTPQGEWFPASTLAELRDNGSVSDTPDESAPKRTASPGIEAKPKRFYFQHTDGRTIGPLTGRELRDAAVAGDVCPETLVSMNPAKSWVPASRVKGLFDESGRPVSHEEYEAAPSEGSAEPGAATLPDSAIAPGQSGPVEHVDSSTGVASSLQLPESPEVPSNLERIAPKFIVETKNLIIGLVLLAIVFGRGLGRGMAGLGKIMAKGMGKFGKWAKKLFTFVDDLIRSLGDVITEDIVYVILGLVVLCVCWCGWCGEYSPTTTERRTRQGDVPLACAPNLNAFLEYD